jgi:NADP-dependent 3-hydroxy acid dehydrogenase YdfG
MQSSENVVVITGATGNLGSATAHVFQAAGARTVLVDRSRERLRATFAAVADSPQHFLAGGEDLSDATSLGRIVSSAIERFGRIDALVHTVGAWRGGKPVHETDLADWDFLFNVNLRTTLLCCRAVIPQMLKQGRGKIVNVASRDGLAGSAGTGVASGTRVASKRR